MSTATFAATHPRELRAAIADGSFGMKPTSGCSKGYLQANLVIIPASAAADFAEFCRLNCRACPLLFQGKPGQRDAPPLATGSDITQDVPAYQVYRRGKPMETVSNIGHLWDESMVAFYMGCSFSFEQALQQAHLPVRNVEQNVNVSMYRTNRQCDPVGPFHAQMVVSMRPMPPDCVTLAQTVTHPSVAAHGGPIHCGDPAAIGITQLEQPDFGDAVTLAPEDVPCFWACGVTSGEAVRNADLELVITHKPGSMFVSDLKETNPVANSCLHGLGSYQSATMAVVNQLEACVAQDPMQRGVNKLTLPTQLWHAATALTRAKTVVLTTGFPCVQGPVPCESDGPLGVVMLATTLARLSKAVVVLVEETNRDVMEAALSMGQSLDPCLQARCTLRVVPNDISVEQLDGLYHELQADAFVAVERAGRTVRGEYCTMKGRVMEGVANLDHLFTTANDDAHVTTIGIGDGGNELGMGKVRALVEQGIPLGDRIACATTTDYLIAAGVSNWGANGLAAAVAIITHEQDDSKALHAVTDEVLERAVLQAMFAAGCKDGVKPAQTMSVDGMLYDDQHVNVLLRLRQLLIS
eukprot:m.57180 g.57180  ORF g.57180 m.57180 type:complete len:581 (+) comp13710_c0_seq1:165-1907(+)